MTRDQIESVVTALSDLLAVLRDADPADKPRSTPGLGSASPTSQRGGLFEQRST